MLAFKMDETNFADGAREGLRIVGGAGLKVDFDEPAADADTLGLWHLHDGACQGEGTGLADASGGGHDLVNHGAESVEDGYRFVRADGDWMEADFAGEPPRSAVTLECWCRAWDVPTGQYGLLAAWCNPAAGDAVYLAAKRDADPALSETWFSQRLGGVYVGARLWRGVDVDAVLGSDEAFHVAGVIDAPSRRLYVGGQARGFETGAGFQAFTATEMRLGRRWDGQATWDLSAVVDTVRVSGAARYAADFAPHRLLEGGAFTSPTFDAVRLQADWIDLVRALDLPDGCSAAWEVRAADSTDAGGAPQALWTPWDGNPADLPDGRYLQWRLALGASADRTCSPALSSAEARASEAGYNLYHAEGPDPDALDYASPWARVGPDVTEIQAKELSPAAVHWFGCRSVDSRGAETPATQDEARLELDAAGQEVGDRPVGVLALGARAAPLGAATLEWRYRVGRLGVMPSAMRIFGDGASGAVDYGSPLGEVPYEEGRSRYAWTTGPLAPAGEAHLLAVRAVTADGRMDEQPAVVPVVPDAVPPAEVESLEAEVIP